MNLWKADKIMDRMNDMLDHAIAGERIESSFDESKMSAIETKLAKYLAMNQLGKTRLQEEKERINELISDISHQTKTPISNLLLYAELLGEEEFEGKERELVNLIHTQAEKLSFLISDMVKASRLESGIIQTIAEEHEIQELIDRAVRQAESKAEGKGIEINAPRTACRAIFDLKWTSEAVFNILDNAVKYTPIGGKIEISITEYQLFVRIDIKDNGVGIPESEISKVFGRFYKGMDAQKEEGVGLGLYLAREIITGQGGYIKVNSKVKEGSLFSVFLRTVS